MRISVSIKRRLEQLELALAIGRPIGLWPQMLSCIDWEAAALSLQNSLQTDNKNDQATIKNFNIG